MRTTTVMTVSDDDDLIPAREVRRRLANCSDMHVWRLTNDPAYAHLRFPKPIKINTRNYWVLGQIAEWVARQANATADRQVQKVDATSGHEVSSSTTDPIDTAPERGACGRLVRP